MNAYQKLSELARLQSSLAPQIEAARLASRAIPPDLLPRLQDVASSPAYRAAQKFAMSPEALALLETAADTAEIQQHASALLSACESSFCALPDEDKEAIVSSIASIEVPDKALERILSNTNAPPDVSCDGAAIVLPAESESAWLQIRRALYPIAEEINRNALACVAASLAPTTVKMDKAELAIYVIAWIVLASILWLGKPDPQKTSK